MEMMQRAVIKISLTFSLATGSELERYFRYQNRDFPD